MKTNRILIISIILILAFVFGCFIFKKNTIEILDENGSKGNIKVRIADTPKKRELGLSNTKKLTKGTGMFFVHDVITDSPYWMIDMNYPLDIIFINEANKIIYIQKGAIPCQNDSECKLIYSPEKYKYVLEINSGEADILNIQIGDTLKTNSLTFVP
jgi:uncharacterized membrane protein (UPF0127 family)